jgi:hypothetical protein
MRDESSATTRREVRHVRLSSGYAYRLEDSSIPTVPVGWWRSAPDDEWETVVIDGFEGELMGTRFIDDCRMVVVRANGCTYAQLARHVVRQ